MVDCVNCGGEVYDYSQYFDRCRDCGHRQYNGVKIKKMTELEQEND